MKNSIHVCLLASSIIMFTNSAASSQNLGDCRISAIKSYCLTMVAAMALSAKSDKEKELMTRFTGRVDENFAKYRSVKGVEAVDLFFIKLGSQAVKKKGVNAALLCIGGNNEEFNLIAQIATNKCREQ